MASAIAFVAALMPWYQPYVSLSLYDDARYVELAFLGVIAVICVFSASRRRGISDAFRALPASFRYCGMVTVLWAGASALQARFPLLSGQEISLFFLLALFGGTCAQLAQENRIFVDRVFSSSFGAAALVFTVVFAMAYAASIQAATPFSWVTPFVSFANIRYFSQYQAYTLPILVLPALVFNLPRRWRMVGLLLASLWWALHFASGTRAVWVAVVVTALVMAVGLKRLVKPWLTRQGWAFALGGLMYSAFAWWSGDFGSQTGYGVASVIGRGAQDSQRFVLWREAWEMLRSAPWLGVGPMHFGFYHSQVAAHPHNAWLQIAAEYGLPVVLILTYWVVRLFLSAFRWCRTAESYEDRQINIALTASLLCGSVDALFSGNTLMPQSQVALFLIAGWLIGRNGTPNLTHRDETSVGWGEARTPTFLGSQGIVGVPSSLHQPISMWRYSATRIFHALAQSIVGTPLRATERNGSADLPNRDQGRSNRDLASFDGTSGPKPTPHGLQGFKGMGLQAAFVLAVLCSIGLQIKGVADYYRFMAAHDFALIDGAHPRFWHDGHWPVSSGFYPAGTE